ncbi:MAG: hypothetical protein DRG78_14595 [Epsilonproteobacteria bacterium]|nr:MAG: hypothetical protein DRG78_14595 [Campylobacterota bacterium]
MNKLIILLLPIAIFAQSFLISNIPLPKTYIQDLDPYECDEYCMQDYLDNDMIFSFLARADKKLENEDHNEIRVMNISILNLGATILSSKVKIAMLLPYKKIGKYASSTTNATFAYLITKSHPFDLKSYKIESEEQEEIQRVLELIQEDGFNHVIAPLTIKGVQNIINLGAQVNIYFPTINKKDVSTDSMYLTFGAIDYEAQSDLLVKEAVSPLIIFSDKSQTGKKLAKYEEQAFKYTTVIDDTEDNATQEIGLFDIFNEEAQEEPPKTKQILNEENVVIKHSISRRTTNLEHYLKDKEEIINGSFFINTPIVKSGMIMSQLTLYDANATNVLSTQINYDPLLLSMTQYIDRKEMIVANSITENNNVLIETNSLLGNDIVYDWINYTTTVGVDYFFHKITNEDRAYEITVEEDQMIYDIELLQPSLSRFIPYISSIGENEELELEEGEE